MAASPKWYDNSNVLLSTPVSVAGTGGTPGTAAVVKLINHKGAGSGDPILNGQLIALSRANGSSDAYAEGGRSLLDRQMLEVRITGGYNQTLSATDWVKVGRGKRFDRLPSSITYDTGVTLELRVNAPADAADVDDQVRFALVDDRGRLIAEGVSLAGGDGVCCPLGDPSAFLIVSGGNVAQDDAGASNDVDVPDFVYLSQGKLWSLRSHEVTIAASTSGKNRYVGVILETDGTSGIVEGSEVVGALADSDKPAIATDEILLAWVQRDDTATIVTADISNTWTAGLFSVTYSGLTATVNPGPYAIVDDSLVYQSGSQNATLGTSVTNYLWLLPSGSLEVTTTDVPTTQVKALILAELDTDGSGVTAFRDRRVISGAHAHATHFELRGDLDTTTYAYATLPNAKAAWLDPLRPILAGIGTQGDHSTGSTLFDVQVRRAGTYTTLFADTADMPTIAYNAGTAALIDSSVIPDRYDLPPFAEIRVKCNTLPTGGANDPDDGQVTLFWRHS